MVCVIKKRQNKAHIHISRETYDSFGFGGLTTLIRLLNHIAALIVYAFKIKLDLSISLF